MIFFFKNTEFVSYSPHFCTCKKGIFAKQMGVLIGIDFGTQRTGLAHSDPHRIIASALCALPTNEVIDYLSDYQKQNPIDAFVVGQPKQKDGNFSAVENDILEFVNALKKAFPQTEIVRQDERYTSKIAAESLLQIGAKRKTRKDKLMIDKISATLILQSFMVSNTNPRS
jgi:putative Holliday junction resolvase